jgi:hypothetical protein
VFKWDNCTLANGCASKRILIVVSYGTFEGTNVSHKNHCLRREKDPSRWIVHLKKSPGELFRAGPNDFPESVNGEEYHISELSPKKRQKPKSRILSLH